MSQINKQKLDLFVKGAEGKSGYDLVREQGIKPTARLLKINHMTIRKIMHKFPEGSKTEKKYLAEFAKSEINSLLKQYHGSESRRMEKYRLWISRGFSFLGNKDPMNWSEEDYVKLWEHFRNPATGFVHSNAGTAFRSVMYMVPEQRKWIEDGRFKTKTQGEGHKGLTWYLREGDIILMIDSCFRKDLLIWHMLGIGIGARGSAFVNPYPEHEHLSLNFEFLDLEHDALQVYEQKVKKIVPKLLHPKMTKLLRTYVMDKNISGKMRIFPESLTQYSALLTRWGKFAGVKHTTSKHIYKHTFAKLSTDHGVSMGDIEGMSGTEARTLKKFYGAVSSESMKKSFQGAEWKTESWFDFYGRLLDRAIQKYATLNV